MGIKVRYMHHDIDTIERMEMHPRPAAWASSMCWSASTCCAKGWTCPEVSLVAILDADKEGFLRSETSLIQTIGRAARNAAGQGYHVRRYSHPLHAAGHR